MSTFSDILNFIFSNLNKPKTLVNSNNVSQIFFNKINSSTINPTTESKLVSKKKKNKTKTRKSKLNLSKFIIDQEVNPATLGMNSLMHVKGFQRKNLQICQQELSTDNLVEYKSHKNLKEILKSISNIEENFLNKKRESDDREASGLRLDGSNEKVYTEDDYSKDLREIEQVQGHDLMRKNFPCEYNYDNFHRNIQRLKMKRQSQMLNMTVPESVLSNILFLSRERQYVPEKNFKKLWSPNKKDSSSFGKEKEYLSQVKSIWCYDIVEYSIELALEYYMKSKYNFVKDKEELRKFLITKRRSFNNELDKRLNTYSNTTVELKSASVLNKNYHLRKKTRAIM